MRGALNYCFSKSWELYGINKEKTRLIHKGDSSSICSLNKIYCDSDSTKSFTIDSESSTVAFTTILFTSNDGSCTNGNHFSTSGLEFFGTLYSTESVCLTSSTINNINILVLFGLIFIN